MSMNLIQSLNFHAKIWYSIICKAVDGSPLGINEVCKLQKSSVDDVQICANR